MPPIALKALFWLCGEPMFPTLLAFLEETKEVRLWKAWCPYCLRWHTHGAGAKEDDPLRFLGHRAAHCDDGSPLTSTGYCLIFGGHWQALTAEQQRYGPGGKALYQELKRKQRVGYGALSL